MRNLIATLMVCAAANAALSAQAHATGDKFVAVRAGANLVGNTFRVRETRPEPGGGGSIGAYLSPNWALEFETWIRAANPVACCTREHETLYSLGVMRLLASGRLQPYMVGGLTFLNGHKDELQVQLGVGAQIPIYQRFAISIDLRGNGGGNTMVVRPTTAFIYHFR
jgi:hypothetical protein